MRFPPGRRLAGRVAARIAWVWTLAWVLGAPHAAWAESPEDAARRITSDRRYQKTFPATEPVTRTPPPVSDGWRPARSWRPSLPPPSAASGLVESLGLVLAGVAGGAAVLVGWRALSRRRGRRGAVTGPEVPPAGEALEPGDAVVEESAIERARRLDAAGRREEAIVLLWRTALRDVGGQTEREDAHLTGRELLAALRRKDALPGGEVGAGMLELLRAMEAVQFARRRTEREDLERCIAAFTRVRSARGSGA